MYLVVNVVMDIFFHLVLASAAVMVVFILNVDDFYQQVKDDELKSLNAIAQDEKLISMLSFFTLQLKSILDIHFQESVIFLVYYCYKQSSIYTISGRYLNRFICVFF